MINRFIPSSIRARLFVFVFLALISPFVLIFYYAVRETRLTSQLNQDTALRLTRLGAESQRQIFRDARNLLVLLSGLPNILLDPVACRSMLSAMPKKFPQFKNMAVSNPQGRITCSSMAVRPGISFSERPWFQRALQTRKFVSSDYLIGKVSREPILVFARPMLDKTSAVTAIISVSVNLRWLNQLSVQADLPAGSVFTVVDRKGTILGHQPDSEKWVGKSFVDADIVKTALASDKPGTREAKGIDGVQRFYAFTTLRDEDVPAAAHLMIGIPRDFARAGTQATLLQNFFLMSLVTYLVLATVWIAGRKLFLERLGSLSAAGRRLAGGDFTARTGVTHAGDEIGELAATFDHMAMALESREEEHRRATEVRARLAAIVESSSDAIFARDLNGIVTNWNRGAEALLGYSAAEMIGHPIVNLIPAEEIEITSQHFERVRRGENPLTFESVRLGKKNKRIQVSVTLSPVKDDLGRIIGVSSILRDISERKKAEREISALHEISLAMASTLELEESLKILLQKIEAVLPYAGSHIRLLNKKSGTIEPVVCRNLDEQGWKSEANLSAASIHTDIIRSKEPVIIPEILLHGGRRRDFYHAQGFVSYLGVPIFVQDEVIGVLSLLTKERHDFSPEEIQFIQTLAKQAGLGIHNSQLYETVKRQATALEEANRQQADFVAMIVHDLRSPLTAIMAIAEMLRDGGFGTATLEQKEWSDRILDNASSLVELISDFLDVSKLETGRISLSTQVIDINSLIKKAVEDHGPLAKKREIHLTYRLVEQEFAAVEGDPRRLDQVLSNMLSNALKFTARGGRIRVEARFEEKQGIRIEVHDTGVGIPKTEIPGLFEKYRQTTSTTVSEQKGTGLGLVICKMIVEAHGGSIWVESQFGRGSTFIFDLPRSAEFRTADQLEQASARSDG